MRGRTLYVIRPGNIAAICYVEAAGVVWTCVYTAAGKDPEATDHTIGDKWAQLPAAVRKSVRGHFDHVFSLPYDAREPYLRTAKGFVWQIEAPCVANVTTNQE
jgi:hypothetical protein